MIKKEKVSYKFRSFGAKKAKHNLERRPALNSNFQQTPTKLLFNFYFFLVSTLPGPFTINT